MLLNFLYTDADISTPLHRKLYQRPLIYTYLEVNISKNTTNMHVSVDVPEDG